MKVTGIFYCDRFIITAVLFLLAACSSKKETATSAGIQNLTARYNIFYNASEQYKESNDLLLEAVPDDYSRFLTVFKEPQPEASKSGGKALDSVLLRANAIIASKAQSNYVDDAWLLTGKVNYLKTEFFNAAEFFDYVYKTYYDDKQLRQEALFWKSRSLMRLKDMQGAAVALDSALKHPVGSDHQIADVYAAEAQFNILSGNEDNAIAMLEKALKTGSTKRNRIRWNYILAQLLEKNGETDRAWEAYTAVVKSNASFEMAFNANMNRMRLKGTDGTPEGKVAALKTLLKQFKNRDFLDQIYFRIAEIYMESGKQELATQNYNLGLAKSTVNRNQKGVIYLKLADLHFRDADYVKAKAYYDSTLSSLSSGFPGYENIRIKSSNLDFLAGRLKDISQQDTLQMLAKLSETDLQPRLGSIVREQIRRAGTSASQPGPFTAAIDGPELNGTGEGKFYFNNSAALTQGFGDFKRRWGNRKLEDNWRRGNNNGTDVQTLSSGNQATSNNTASVDGTVGAAETLIREMMAAIPGTDAELKASDQKIINSYYDIAGFYKDDLKDNAEAIKTYQLLLNRYPQNNYRSSVYYNLYRLYSGSDPVKAAQYRALLISEFPESLYTNVILDPDYARKADQKALSLNAAYTEAYTSYTGRNYRQVISLVGQTETKYANNALSPQLAYLAALATGHLQKIDTLEQTFRKLVETYPTDQVVTPLVNQHLDFIKANREMLGQRVVALTDSDPEATVLTSVPAAVKEPIETPLLDVPPQKSAVMSEIVAKEPAVKEIKNPTEKPAAEKIPEKIEPVITPPESKVIAKAPEELPAKPVPFYELPEQAEYYFVINVNDSRVNLNPSRFGLGQFIRSNYSTAGIRHETKDVADVGQLIFVGKFPSLQSAKAYESKILPLMKDIMKIPAEKYNTFVITRNELDKLNGKTAIDQYADFYKRR